MARRASINILLSWPEGINSIQRPPSAASDHVMMISGGGSSSNITTETDTTFPLHRRKHNISSFTKCLRFNYWLLKAQIELQLGVPFYSEPSLGSNCGINFLEIGRWNTLGERFNWFLCFPFSEICVSLRVACWYKYTWTWAQGLVL